MIFMVLSLLCLFIEMFTSYASNSQTDWELLKINYQHIKSLYMLGYEVFGRFSGGV